MISSVFHLLFNNAHETCGIKTNVVAYRVSGRSKFDQAGNNCRLVRHIPLLLVTSSHVKSSGKIAFFECACINSIHCILESSDQGCTSFRCKEYFLVFHIITRVCEWFYLITKINICKYIIKCSNGNATHSYAKNKHTCQTVPILLKLIFFFN